ncbi:MAG: N-6 DNA methylase [Propionibacteriaceae bacterium]|nr:N-6 DNA methylase [Propionibacteriaceae bacterium]
MTLEPADTAELRKARGAFFTPPSVTTFLTTWAIRSGDDDVLEPSCGDGAFVSMAARRIVGLSGRGRIHAHELHSDSAQSARAALTESGVSGDIFVGDFLAVEPRPIYDAVIGNPPYIRYQGFTGDARAKGLAAALRQGVRLSKLSSSWAPFVIHASAFLRGGGRLALVLPAELLTSNYAQDVRDFLLRRFGDVRVVRIDKQVFPGVQTEALLLLAEGHGGSSDVHMASIRSADDLNGIAFTRVPATPGQRWQLLPTPETEEALADLVRQRTLSELSSWGRLSLGAVTGNNRYFALSPVEAARWGLSPTDTVAISPPGSSHLRALEVSYEDWAELGARGAGTLLFRPTTPSGPAEGYLTHGKELGVDRAYKCRVRTPWWRTPLPEPPDLFFTYMNQQTPQLAANPAGLYYLNSVHGLYLHDDLREWGALLALGALNTATALSAEITGRAYGGGVLKMEPREATKLLVPSIEVVRTHATELQTAFPDARRSLLAGRLSDAQQLVDDILLSPTALPSHVLAELREALSSLRNRRHTRTRTEAKGGRR